MIIIAAVDDRNGMAFNHRRQSRDRELVRKILSLTAGSCLWMDHYSAEQFRSDVDVQVRADENFLDRAAPGEYCFVEDRPVAPYAEKTEKVILFRWNRRYPGDLFFDIDVKGANWHLEKTEDFAGFSHERITMEVYAR